MPNRRWKVVGISFDHFHMGDLLRMAIEHPQADVAGVWDSQIARVEDAAERLGLPRSIVFDDYNDLMRSTQPDLVMLCSATSEHALWVERLAPFRVPILIEKPFARSLADADRMIDCVEANQTWLAINWPLVWRPSHRTAYRLAVEQRRIGEIIGVNYCGGNRGPLWHTFDKRTFTRAEVDAAKPSSWFYDRALGGGSLLDYLGYGATLATWFLENRAPLDVTSVVDQPPGIDVDEHSVTICRYAFGLSHMETRWGTFTDPWTHSTQPVCGLTIIGRDGTIHSGDYGNTIRLQDAQHPQGIEIPVEPVRSPYTNPVQYMLHCLESGSRAEGPLSCEVSRIGQQIVDTAYQASQLGRTLPLCTK